MLIEVKVGALIMDPNSSTPIVVLKGVEGEAILPIWVGVHEANAIALEIEKIVPQRPMTHDLLRNVIVQLGYTVKSVIVNNLLENTFYASIEMADQNEETVILDARPSDAIALALRADCPIYIDQNVLNISALSPTSDKVVTESKIENSTEEWPDLIE